VPVEIEMTRYSMLALWSGSLMSAPQLANRNG